MIGGARRVRRSTWRVRCVTASRRAAVARRRRRRPGARGDRWWSTSPASSPQRTGQLRVAMLQGDDEELSLAEQRHQPLTDDHLALADRAARATTTSSCSPRRARHRPGAATRRCARAIADLAARARRVGARERACRRPRGDANGRTTASQLEPALRARRHAAGQVLEAAPRAVRRVRAVARRLLGFLDELAPSALRLRRRATATVVFDVRRHTRRQRHLLRVGVRPARARLRARRRRGDRREHQQPLVPSVGEHRAAPRARPDARGGDRAAGAAGVGVGHQRGDRSPTARCTTRPKLFEKAIVDTHHRRPRRGETLYVRFGDWVVWACCSRCSPRPSSRSGVATVAARSTPKHGREVSAGA